jgi:predicted membrane-bound spermidine synthase
MRKEVIKANMVVFIASFCTLVIELVAGRIMAPHVGVSLYTWTSIIGVVLAGISIGAYVGGLLADRYPHATTLGWLLFLSGLGAFSISPLANLLGGTEFQTGLMVRILLLTAIIFFIPSCLLGMISPVVVKLTLKNLKKTGNVVGKIYAFSTLGSILGTFATGFFLISWMGTRSILLITGAILICCAPIFGGFFRKTKTLALFVLIIVLLPTLPLAALYGYAAIVPGSIFLPASPLASIKDAFAYASQPLLHEDIYFFKESNYYTITLQQETGDEERPLETLVLDHLVHSYTDLRNPFYLKYEYIRTYEEVVRWQEQKRKTCNVLFIGGGGYTFPRFIDAQYPHARIDVVEIDPEIILVGQRFLGVTQASRIRSFNEDARWFIMNSKEEGKYDFVFGDAFNDLSIPYHLTTKEFSAHLKRLMKPDGLLLTNVIDSFKQGTFLSSYVRTLEEVFGKGNVHLILPSSDYDTLGIGTCVVVASPLKLDMNNFMRSVQNQKGNKVVSYVMPAQELQQYLTERSSVILTDDYVPVDNLLAPIFEERFGYRRQ